MRDDRADGETAPVSPVDGDVAAGVGPGEAGAETPETGAEDAIQAELTRLQQETAQLRELYLRKLADFDNFRKRKDKEMSDFRRQANADLVRDLLPVVDNLERAVGVGGEDSGGVRAGVELTLRQLRDVLSRVGRSYPTIVPLVSRIEA